MREIIFRGFHPDTNSETIITFEGIPYRGYWHEGGISFDRSKTPYICPERFSDYDEEIEVIPATVGQFTGLTDKNGNKVFENDIVKVRFWSDWGECYEVSNGTIKWENGNYVIYISHYCMRLNLADHPEMVVIGNTFDNPSF